MSTSSGHDAHRFDVCEGPIDLGTLLAEASAPELGAIVSFVGSVRSPNHGVSVRHIDYEGYRPMMLAEMARLAHAVDGRHGGIRCIIVHRLGRLGPGEISLAVVAAAVHRAAALRACEELVEGLKARLPVWKYEVGVSGGAFVAGRADAGPTL